MKKRLMMGLAGGALVAAMLPAVASAIVEPGPPRFVTCEVQNAVVSLPLGVAEIINSQSPLRVVCAA